MWPNSTCSYNHPALDLFSARICSQKSVYKGTICSHISLRFQLNFSKNYVYRIAVSQSLHLISIYAMEWLVDEMTICIIFRQIYPWGPWRYEVHLVHVKIVSSLNLPPTHRFTINMNDSSFNAKKTQISKNIPKNSKKKTIQPYASTYTSAMKNKADCNVACRTVLLLQYYICCYMNLNNSNFIQKSVRRVWSVVPPLVYIPLSVVFLLCIKKQPLWEIRVAGWSRDLPGRQPCLWSVWYVNIIRENTATNSWWTKIYIQVQ